ncbi:MAG: hypothetical protein Q7T35_09375 [Nitrosomonas sp.]|nr:hypothetical protein [Nitrosomonas sp.]
MTLAIKESYVPHIAQLLQQIADNTAHDDSLWIAAVTGGAAILGVGVTEN